MKRVLVVDDSAELRRLMSLMLRHRYLVQLAGSAEEALDLLQAQPADALVLDINLPGAMDGLDLLARLRATPDHAGLPVVMVSARGRPSDRYVAESLVVQDYLTKPFSPLALVDCVDRLLAPAPAP